MLLLVSISSAVIVAPPRGVRGLKSERLPGTIPPTGRTPSWGAWIEMRMRWPKRPQNARRTPSWGAWIEMEKFLREFRRYGRTPSWGAWIEMVCPLYTQPESQSHPLVGCVD